MPVRSLANQYLSIWLTRYVPTLLAMLVSLPAAHADDATWAALKTGEYVILMRHAATEPGIGDPPGFTLANCDSQRKLSADGRRQAQKLGEEFRRRAIPIAHVWSSRWCRCTDTAMLAFGQVKPMTMLDSAFLDNTAAEQQKLRDTYAAARTQSGNGNLVMVTHQVNITEMTGIYPAMGEMIVVTLEPGGKFKVVGRISITKD
jgi:phosphohistidine phosphatase SixA